MRTILHRTLTAGIMLAMFTGHTQAASSTAEEEAKAAALKVAVSKVATARKALAEAQKAAAKLETNEKVEAIKIAARKAAQERLRDRKDVIDAMEKVVTDKNANALKTFQESAFKEKIARDKNTVQEAETATTEAEKALAEKDADVTKTESEAKAAKAAAVGAPNDKDLEKKASVAKTAADRALRSRNGALNTLRSKKATADAGRTQVDLGKDVIAELAKADSLNKAYDDAVASATAAKKAIAVNDNAIRKASKDTSNARSAAKNAANKANSTKAASDRATAALASAEKSLTKAQEVEKKAEGKNTAKATATRKTTEKKRDQLAAVAKKATTEAARAKEEKDTLAKKVPITEAAAKKLASEKPALTKARSDADKKVAVAKKSADQTNSVIRTFESASVAEKIDQERIAHETAITEKENAEKALAKSLAAIKSSSAKADSAKSASDRAAATLTSAEKSNAKRMAAAKDVTDRITTGLADTNKALAKARKLEKEADQKSVAKAKANRKAVEKRLSQQTAAKQKSDSQAAILKKSIGKNIGKLTVEAKKAAAAATSARTTADKAISMNKAAKGNVALDDGPARKALSKLYQAQALVDAGLTLLPADQWDYAKARHLLCRAGFGGTPQEVEALHAMGLHAAVEFMVDFHEQATMDLPFTATLPERPVRDENRLSRERRREITNVRRRVESLQQTRLRDWWMERMAQSPRQLEEKLALFWHGHFATEYRTTRSSYAMYEQNQLFREHAAGNFGALLHGIVHDPAMLRYLDNNSNVKGRPNENLAREIMELFSLGEGNYAEEDIMEGARALTGYTYDTNTSQFRFIVSRHDPENKTIFGRTGTWAGDDFVDLILRQPFTPRFIARKLFVYFAYENPDEEVVHRMASVLSKHQYEMAPMLKNLFMSKEFYSDKSMATQIKNPVQLVIGTLRDLGVKEISYRTLGGTVASMGQEIFGPPNVRGWEGGQFWVNANRLFVRYNGIADLVERSVVPDQSRGLNVIATLEGKKLDTPDQVIDYLAKSCLIRPLSQEKKKLLIEQAASLPPCSEWESQRNQVNATLQAILVLMMSMPEYQCI